MKAIRVMIGEDGFIPRQGIERALQGMDGIDHAGTWASFDGLREAIRAAPPDVIITNLRTASSDGAGDLRLPHELRDSHPGVGVLVLTEETDTVFVRRLFERGIEGRGYLVKDEVDGPDTMRTALGMVAAGSSYVDPAVLKPFLAALQPDKASIDWLTTRETGILALVAEGWSNHAIAGNEGITTRAVERHISAIFSKLGLTDDEAINRRVKVARLYLTDARLAV